MTESNKSYLKRILRIAAFTLGCLITVVGIISGAYAFAQLPEDMSKFMRCVVTAIFALLAGIGLCILAVKLPKHLAESRKLSKEEKVIRNIERYLQRRNGRIVMFTFMLVFLVSASMLIFWCENEVNKMTAPEQIRSKASFENPKHELPTLFSRFYFLGAAKAKFIVYEMYFGTCTGFVIFMFINEFAGFTKNKHLLTLSMWRTIKRLEGEVKELKAQIPTN